MQKGMSVIGLLWPGDGHFYCRNDPRQGCKNDIILQVEKKDRQADIKYRMAYINHENRRI